VSKNPDDLHVPMALGEPDFAQRTVVIWHVLFGAMVLAAGLFLTIDGHGLVAIPLLAVLVAAYVVLALNAMRCDDLRRSVLYLVIAVTIMLVLEWQDPAALVLLFAIFSQIFVLLPRRGAIVATVIVSLAFSLVLVALDDWSRDAWVVHGFTAAGNIAFALVIGLFIDGIVRESARRKQLLLELEETRDDLAAAEREAGAVAERERLARDIHDTLAQGFTSIVMLAQAGEAASGRGDHITARRRFEEIQATARDNLAEARALVGAMTPPALEGAGLVDAVTRLTDRFAAESGTSTEFRVLGEPRPLAAASDVAALRATQEALSNVRKHSGASHISVVLAYDEDGATVAVSDDGTGFDVSAPRQGYGLDGLSSRIEAVGGIAEVDSTPGAGTRVRVRVP
jgi:signal transduction histidine kinase